mgnify:FL=1
MKLRFTTISSVILSPRMDKALYKGVDFKEIETNIGKQDPKKMDNINIVYPFYSYEDRDLLSEKSFSYANEYHIPASSLKGALLVSKRDENEDALRSKILFKDINISKEDVELKNLYKFQYLYQEAEGKNNNNGQNQLNYKQNLAYKTPKLEPFFPSVAIEMIGIEKKFESEILLKADISEELLDNKLEESYSITKRKLDSYIDEIKQRVENINSWIKDGKLKKGEEKEEDYIRKLECIEHNIESLIKDGKKIFFLGGYKGILGSLTTQLDENQKVKNGFYIDEGPMLPYGLVEVKKV